MQFKELSAILKQKRIEQSITQEELAQKLKIPLRGIIALEEGGLDELPHETYIRTFTKEYAKLVGLDVDNVRAMLNTIEEFEAQAEPPKSMEAIHAESEPKGAKSKGVRIAVPLLLLALLGTTAYFYYSNGKLNLPSVFSMSFFSASSSSENTKNTTSNNDKVSEQKKQEEKKLTNDISDQNKKNSTNTSLETLPENTESINQEASQSSDTQQLEANQNTASITTEKNKENETKKEDSTLKNAQAEHNFETFVAKTPEASLIDWSDFNKNGDLSKQAIIYVNQDCWMQVIVDGKDGHFTLRAKNQRKFDFNKSLQFKIGNASAVTLFHGYDLVDVGDSSVLRIVTLNAK